MANVRSIPRRDAARFFVVYLAVAPFFLAPLFATHFLPALDLPHHLAIADALTKADLPDSPYAKTFAVSLGIAPFDAHFVLLVALSHVTSLVIAAKILIGAQVLALPLACARLLAACRRSVLPALLAFPLGYAMPVHYGLLAFVLAVPVLIWAFAEATDQTAWTRRPRRQTARLAAALTLLFFFHLEAYAVGVAVAIVVVAAHPLTIVRRSLGLVAALPSLAALALYVAHASPESTGGPSIARAFVDAIIDEFRELGFLGTLVHRAVDLPVHLLRGFADKADVRASYAYFTIVLTLALVGWRVQRSKGGTITRSAAPAILFVAAFTAYFFLPHHVGTHAHSIYPRFSLVLALVALLAIPGRLAHANPRGLDYGAATLMLAVALYAGILFGKYRAFGRELADFETLLQRVPAGRSVGGLVFDGDSSVMHVQGILTGVPAYYAVERRAPSSFSYLYYCRQPHLPCRFRRPDEEPAMPHFTHPEELDAMRALKDIDVFLVRGGPAVTEIFGDEGTWQIRLLARSGNWRAFERASR